MRFVWSLFEHRPSTGLIDGHLRPCPASPNCVCSEGDSSDAIPVHAVSPLKFNDHPAEAWSRLERLLTEMPRVKIVSHDQEYLHAEFTSLIWRFVDDVEFRLDEVNRVIHVRSASRVGYSDLGANRARVEALRKRFDQN